MGWDRLVLNQGHADTLRVEWIIHFGRKDWQSLRLILGWAGGFAAALLWARSSKGCGHVACPVFEPYLVSMSHRG